MRTYCSLIYLIFDKRLFPCRFAQCVYLVGIFHGLLQALSSWLPRIHPMSPLGCTWSWNRRGRSLPCTWNPVNRPQICVNKCRNIQQGVGLAAVADDERHAVLVVKVAPLKAGRSVKVVSSLQGPEGWPMGYSLPNLRSVVLAIVPAHRTNDLNLFGSRVLP